MVQLIVGEKGKGKTKILLDKVNTEIKEANGTFVYLDKSKKHMYELNNKVRLISATDYPLKNSDEFIGFLSGILSQDNDLEKIFLDSFLKISKVTDEELADVLKRLQTMGEKYHVSFVLSVSKDAAQLPECAKEMLLVSM